jgi:hypothetical protein
MLQLTCHLIYRVDDILTAPSMLGARIDGGDQESPVEIALPSNADDFSDESTGKRLVPFGVVTASDGGTDPDAPVAVNVRALRLQTEVAIDWVGPKVDPRQSEDLRTVSDAATEAWSRCDRALITFLEWARTDLRQPWLSVTGETPEVVLGPVLTDPDGSTIPFQLSRADFAYAKSGGIALQPDQVESLQAALSTKDATVRLPEVLLADATHLARARGEGRLIVLLAAVAAELKVKEALRSQTPRAATAAIELLFDAPRDFSMQVAALFDKAMSAGPGRSLRDDDRDKYKEIVWLFETRNAVAHRGQSIDIADAWRAVDAARGAFDWLDSRVDDEAKPRVSIETQISATPSESPASADDDLQDTQER